MDDSESGGLVSTEEEHSGESDPGNLEKKISKLKLKLKGFQQVVQERDTLRQELQKLNTQVEELIVEREKLNNEHAQELAVLSSSISEHFSQASPSQDKTDSSKLNAQYEKELQKLRLSIEDKNYHINNLQQKLLEAQLELEAELDRHEEEVEDLRSLLAKRDSDFGKLVEERLSEVRSQYETELEVLRAKIEAAGNGTGEESNGNSTENSSSECAKEVAELTGKLQELEERNVGVLDKDIEDRLEEERTKYRVEIMSVKDKMMHQHQLEIDQLITQLEQSNSEVEDLKEQLRQEKVNIAKAENNVQGQNTVNEGSLKNGLDNTSNEDGSAQVKSFVILSNDTENDTPALEALKIELHTHYQQQIEHVAQKLREEYQGELDESLSKMEEEWEQQLEKQKNEYEEKIASLQRHLKNQYQSDLDQVTADMDDQIQVLRDSHSEEVAELLGRLRELSEERRKSVIQQDTTEQQVVIIKEEYRSKVVSLEQELRVEKEKVVEYQRQMDAVEAQVQAFKAEKEQELKLIEEELRRQCKALVEKKANELKERYQSELTEKLNNAERHWRKQYEEDVGKTRSELEESNRTLKDKYERQVSDIMVQMDEVQQRSREVLLQEKKQFEEQQKEQFEKQLSEVKEELQPYKDRYLELEKENQLLSAKYERDLSELRSKMSEVEGRYEVDKGIEEEQLKTLRNELELYKNKIQQLQEGKESLMENYEAQLANLKKKYDEMEDGEIKTLQAEVKVYIKKATNLESEKLTLTEKYEAEVKSLKLLVEELTSGKEARNAEITSLEEEKGKLAALVSELSQNVENLKSNYTVLEEEKNAVDNKYSEELDSLRGRIKDLKTEVENYQHRCEEMEEAKRASEENFRQEIEILRSNVELESNVALSRDRQLQDLMKEKEELALKLSKLQSDSEILQTKYDNLQLNSKTAEDEHSLEISKLQKELSEGRERNRELLSEEKQVLEGRLKQLEEILKESVEKYELLEEAKKSSDEQHATDVASLMSELNILRNLNTEVERLRKMEKEKENLELEVSILKDEVEACRAKITELDEINSRSAQEIISLKDELSVVKNAENAKVADIDRERKRFQEEFDALKKLSNEQANTIRELEDEGENKFGVLLSQHEKELESLKEELEEQIAKKREQLSKDAAAKRQRLKEEYESKLRVLYEELVAEKTRMKDLTKLNDSLNKKVNASQEENNLLSEEVERLKDLEEKLAALEEQLTKDHEARLQQLAQDYEAKVKALEKTINNLKTSREDDNKREFESLKEKQQSLEEYREKIESLENMLSDSKAEVERLTFELRTLEEKRESELDNLRESYDEKIKKSDEEGKNLLGRIEESQKDHEWNVQSMMGEIGVLKKQLDQFNSENKKLQTMISHLDAAKQSVVQMYDEKIDVLVGELEEASNRAAYAEENLKEKGEKFVKERDELKNKVTQLSDEKKKMIEEHGSTVHSLERTLNTEIESKEVLEKTVEDLKEQLSAERAKLGEKVDEASSHTKMLADEFEAKAKMIEDELRSEREEGTRMRQVIGEQDGKLTQHAARLGEMDNILTEKESTIATSEKKLKNVTEELKMEKDKTSKLEKEMQTLLEKQSSEYVQSLERLRNDLKQEYEETKEQLEKNYENIFAKMEEEHRVSCEEKKAEVESLKGMVENLEQLNQLKDEEYEVLMAELTNNHESRIGELQKSFEKEKIDFEDKVNSANKQRDEVRTEKSLLVQKHKIDLTDLECNLVEKHQTKLNDVIKEAEAAKVEHEQLKQGYEKEIESIKGQLALGNAFHIDLQNDHEKKLQFQKEALEEEHRRQVENMNADFQEKLQQVETSKNEMQEEVKELTFKLEESQLEIGVLKENLTNLHDAKVKILETQLQDKIQECEILKEQMDVQILRLTAKVEELTVEKDSMQSNEDAERLKLGYEVLLASLRVENNELNDQVQSLREEIQSANSAHQQEIDLTKAELERQYKQREDYINKKHSQELGKLMEKLESLLQQENASKTLTEEHMQDIGTLRTEFDEKLHRLMQEKRSEVEESKRNFEQQLKEKMSEYLELVKKKDLEIKDLQNDIKVLLNRIDSIQIDGLGHQKVLDKASEDLSNLRRENSELYRKLREEIAKGRSTWGGISQRAAEQIQMENERLKTENDNLKKLINRPSLVANGREESTDQSEGSHVLQLIKLMEQLVKEKNTLELKLRHEILDLKTRFGFLGDTSKTSLENDGLLSVSLSPTRHPSKDTVVGMLQELRENKLKQEEDIKAHILETENMMSEIKAMIDSAEFTDRGLQDMLQSQIHHLEQQRKLLVQRLWQLREKHKSVEEKISRQLANISSQSSPSDSTRSKCYESIIEENIRREKELLALKRQQVEDLNTRIALEKVALERHSMEKQSLEKEMKEKDKLETELTTQRRDLQRKWVGRLREKEFELKREQEILADSKRKEELDGLIRRHSSPRPTDHRAFTDFRVENQFPQAAHSTRPVEPYKNDRREKPMVLPRVISRMHAQAKDAEMKEPKTTNKAIDEWLSRGRQEREGNPVTRPKEKWCQKSKRPSGKKEKMAGDRNMNAEMLDLDLSSDDSDIDLGIVNDSSLLDVNLDDDDSDVELYGTQSIEGFENFDDDWEMKLEEELKQISALGVASSNLRKDAMQKVHTRGTNSTDFESYCGATKKPCTTDTPHLSKLDSNWLRKLSFEYTHTRGTHPRTSTSRGIDKETELLNFTDISRIESQTASYPKELHSRVTLQGNETNPSRKRTGSRPSASSSFASQRLVDSMFPLQRKASKESGIDSPTSVRSEPAGTGKTTLSSRYSQRNEYIGGVYLLNVDEYVDRHMVKSSEQVARLRDLSPSEKRFDL